MRPAIHSPSRRTTTSISKLHQQGKPLLVIIAVLCCITSVGQMRQIHFDPTGGINAFSFYNDHEGYISSVNDYSSIGYTADSGHTFTKIFLTRDIVNFNGYNTVGELDVSGIVAFNKNDLIVFGGYSNKPAILVSSDAGTNFKLVYSTTLNVPPDEDDGAIGQMFFPGGGNTGYTYDNDHILKTTDRGLHWTSVYFQPLSFLEQMEPIDGNNLIVYSPGGTTMLKTADGGQSWQTVTITGNGEGLLKYA